jgi:hypothetical protein
MWLLWRFFEKNPPDKTETVSPVDMESFYERWRISQQNRVTRKADKNDAEIIEWIQKHVASLHDIPRPTESLINPEKWVEQKNWWKFIDDYTELIIPEIYIYQAPFAIIWNGLNHINMRKLQSLWWDQKNMAIRMLSSFKDGSIIIRNWWVITSIRADEMLQVWDDLLTFIQFMNWNHEVGLREIGQ